MRGEPGVFTAFMRHDFASVFVWLLAVPFLIYAITFVGRFDYSLTAAPWSETSWFGIFWNRHVQMASFHVNVEATSSFQSPAWSWFLLKRPLSQLAVSDGTYTQILMIGNPLVWWSFVPALGYITVRWARRRTPFSAESLIVVGFVATYGFWLLPLGRPATFIFYVLPTLPFAYLALGSIAHKIGHLWEGRAALAALTLAVAALFAFYYPVLVGQQLSERSWRARIGIFDDCERRAFIALPAESATTGGQSTPPLGWCWL